MVHSLRKRLERRDGEYKLPRTMGMWLKKLKFTLNASHLIVEVGTFAIEQRQEKNMELFAK